MSMGALHGDGFRTLRSVLDSEEREKQGRQTITNAALYKTDDGSRGPFPSGESWFVEVWKPDARF